MSADQEPVVGETNGSEPMPQRHPESSRVLEKRIGRVLGVGVVVAAGLLAIGLPAVMFQPPAPVGAGPTVREALAGVRSFDLRAFAALGVLALVATPILQLLTSALFFWRRRDRMYVILTLTVCVIVAVGALLTGGTE
jgi:uncharacterized membrane protein